MRKFTGIIAAAALLMSTSAYGGDKPKAGDLHFGDKAPMAATKMMGVDGKDYSIESVKGKNGTLVMFSCNACPWVKAWEDRIAAIGNAAQKDGFGVIVINSNDPNKVTEDSFDAMKKRAKARGFAFPYVVDATSKVAAAFGATRTPEVFLFDKTGKLAYHGAIDDNAHHPEEVEAQYLKDALASLKAGKAVATMSTKALGCTIKWRGDS